MGEQQAETTTMRLYEEMLDGLSDRCKERIDSFEEILQDLQIHRVEEGRPHFNESAGQVMTHQERDFLRQ